MQPEIDISKTLANLMDVATAGFVLGLHIRFTTPTYLFQTYPKAWIEEYSRDGLLLRDPAVAWVLSNEGHVSWEELAPLDQDRVFERAAAHGLVHGVTMSLVRDGSRSLGGFARPDRYFTPGEIERIEAGMTELHEATASTRPLSPELRESLRRLSIAFTHP